MKKTLVCAMALLFTLCVPTFASADQLSCTHLWDEENEYGGMMGFYVCVDSEDEVTYGFGPPMSSPDEW